MALTKKQKGWWIARPIQNRWSFPGGEVVCCDAADLLRRLKPGSADVIFLDPPFNLGKAYGRRDASRDRILMAEYERKIIEVLVLSTNVLRNGGALYIYHIPFWGVRFARILQDMLHFRHWIAISMKNGFARGRRLYPAHYSLLYFTKGEPAVFKRPKRKPPTCRHCGEYLRDYGGYVRFVEKGINLADIWDDLSPVRHKNRKFRKANELPKELLKRIFEMSARKGGLLVDPFAGTGTTAMIGRDFGMSSILGDNCADYCRLMHARLSKKVHSPDIS